jgi:hypothetical protein
MINEINEANSYIQAWENGEDILSNDVRFKEAYFAEGSAGRTLTVVARHYWHDEEAKKIEDIKQKIEYVKDKLYKFYKEITVGAYEKKIKDMEAEIENEKNEEIKEEINAELTKYSKKKKSYQQRLRRYDKDWLEQRNFTFYSIIADAVNEGELLSEKFELTDKEILYALEKTEYKKNEKERSVGSQTLALALIAYYKFADHNKRLLKNGFAQITGMAVSAWFGNVKTWEEDKKKCNDCFQIDTIRGSVRFKVDIDEIKKKYELQRYSYDEGKHGINKIEIEDDKSFKEKLSEIVKKYHEKYLKENIKNT